jgi:hypothetical protein
MKDRLNGCKALFIGAMEKDREGGASIREYVKKEMKGVGVTLWDHYANPIMNDATEGDDELFEQLLQLREERDYDGIAAHKQIRMNDLALIDRADFIICQIDMEKLSCGTWEELFTANRRKAPIFIHAVQGKHNLPFWMFWTLPHKYFYNDLDDIIDTLYKINAGDVEIDSDRWKLLKPEFR